jgi:hypothetical protein
MGLQLARDSRCVARFFAEAIALWTGHTLLVQSCQPPGTISRIIGVYLEPGQNAVFPEVRLSLLVVNVGFFKIRAVVHTSVNARHYFAIGGYLHID